MISALGLLLDVLVLIVLSRIILQYRYLQGTADKLHETTNDLKDSLQDSRDSRTMWD